MARHGTRVTLAITIFAVTLAGSAAAQADRHGEPFVFGDGATYEVRFDDDPLAALPNDAIVPRIVVRKGVPSARLHRPRTQFVSEMLESAERF